jgi:hypothetical protein
MKRETISKGNFLINQLGMLVDYISILVSGRAHYYADQKWCYDGPSLLNSIDISMLNTRQNKTDSIHFLFKDGDLRQDEEVARFISPEARSAIKYISINYKEQIQAILLQEEIRLQKEFENLKDE